MRIRKPQLLRADELDSCLPVDDDDAAMETKAASLGDSAATDSPSVDEDDQHQHLHMTYSPAKFRSSLNWLNKLRAFKGFPTEGSNLGIEDFLASQSLSSTGRSCSNGDGPIADDSSEASLCRLGSQEEYSGGSSTDRYGGEVPLLQNHDFDIPKEVACTFTSHNNSSDIAEQECGPCSTIKVALHSATSSKGNAVANGLAAVPLETSCRVKLSSPVDLQSSIGNLRGSENSGISRDGLSQEMANLRKHYLDMFAKLFCTDECCDQILNGPTAAGSNDTVLKKKCMRKQENPRFCPTAVDADHILTALDAQTVELVACQVHDHKDTAALTSQVVVTSDEQRTPSSPPDMQTLEDSLLQQPKCSEETAMDSCTAKENDESQVASINEVFIIDTSIRGWRAEKVILRKGNSWKFKDKSIGAIKGKPSKGVVLLKKKGRRPRSFQKEAELSYLKQPKKQQQSSICREEDDKDVGKSLMVTGAWKTAPQTNARSQRKRRKNAGPDDDCVKASKAAYLSKPEQPITTAGSSTFAPDHPANQPKEGLIFSIYQVFMQAGKAGLTAREAVSRILEQGLPGLHEGGVVPRVEVLKIISNSPYFMPLVESKYILCSALVGDEDQGGTSRKEEPLSDHQHKDDRDVDNCDEVLEGLETVKQIKQPGIAQYWAACAAIRRARTGKTRRKPSSSLQPCFDVNSASLETIQQQAIGVLSHNTKRLKSLKQDIVGLGNPCNRSDGKGWHCPLRAKVGYLLCDHHLDRLRGRVKSKMLSVKKKKLKKGRKKVLGDAWMSQKTMGKNRMGRPAQASIKSDTQNKPNPSSWEVSCSRDYFRYE